MLGESLNIHTYADRKIRNANYNTKFVIIVFVNLFYLSQHRVHAEIPVELSTLW